MLYCGEQIGNGTLEPQVDIAVDPLDGTTSIALVCLSISVCLVVILTHLAIHWQKSDDCWFTSSIL